MLFRSDSKITLIGLQLFKAIKRKTVFLVLIFCGKIMYSACMSFETIEKSIKDKLAYAPQLDAKIKFDFGDEGLIFIDGTQNPATMSNDDEDADTTFICSLDLFKKIADGSQDATMAYMTGKLKIQGSMGHALKLSSLLSD